MIDKIYICSDFLMTKEKEQASNRRWLLDLLKRPILQATAIEPISFGSSLTKLDAFSRIKFFQLSGLELNIELTQAWFSKSTIRAESIEYLSKYIDDSVLVIGYELSEQTRQILDKLNVPWIDIWLHPVRFLDDILFGFSSSSPDIYQKISQFNLDESIFYAYADRLKIQYYKGYQRPALNLANDSAVFIGQTLEDKAVCQDGRMLSLLDFKGDFEKLGRNHSTTYYSRHPFVKSGDEQILKFVKSCNFAKLTNLPTYHMLASGRVKKVVSISSSVAHEAKYFDISAEFLFKPVFNIGNVFGRDYLSIFQEFISPHFWAEVLSPLATTCKCPRVAYLDPKDKLRDMLNFYWSYRQVDKLEDSRQTLIALAKRISGEKPRANRVATPKETKKVTLVERGINWETTKANIHNLIEQHSVISFDIFDTLIERPLLNPSDLFDLMTDKAREIVGQPNFDFKKYRLEARSLVKKGLHGEEVTLNERYTALSLHLGFTQEMGDSLRILEEETEEQLCCVRAAGKELYDSAVQLGKVIVLVSDTYFEHSFVEKMLVKNGYAHYKKLFTSSKEKKLKHTGSLFDEVIMHLHQSPNSILHIGDNLHSDVAMANAKGLSSFHLQSASDGYKAKSLLFGKTSSGSTQLSSAINSLIAKRICGRPNVLDSPSHAGSNPSDFGYCIAGPLFYGFSNWLVQKSKEDQVQELFFLSRDGHVIQRCFDEVVKARKNNPKSTYLRASRRGVNIPAISSFEDILKLIDLNFSPTSVGSLFRNRFGLKSISERNLQEQGFTSDSEVVHFNKDRPRLRKLAKICAIEILDIAKTEREILLEYYQSLGLMSPNKKAIIDIGHSGTLQRSIAKLTNNPSLGAYYFATSNDIDKNLTETMVAKSYYCDRFDTKLSSHPYSRYILMFESLFLNDEGSFINMRKVNEAFVPNLLNVEADQERAEFIRMVHDGAVSFCRDITATPFHEKYGPTFTANDAASGFLAFLRNPSVIDAEMFRNIAFENMFSGRDSVRFISTEGSREEAIAKSLWKEGAIALNPQIEATNTNSFSPVDFLIRRLSTERKYRKFINSPRLFFADSKNPLIRMAGRVLGY